MVLRVALLGGGRIAQLFHAPILGRMADVSVVALAETEPGARDRTGDHVPGAARFADWRKALDVVEPDAAVICLPPALHALAATSALDAGMHVYVEKPLALDLAAADGMLAAQRRRGKVAMVGFNFRFNPLMQDARARIARGDLGRLLAVRTLFASARRPLPGWKADPRAGGGAIADLGTHHVDLVAWLARSPFDPASVSAREVRGPDGSIALIGATLEDGTLAEIVASQRTGTSANVVQILGERAHLTVDLADAAPRPLETPPGRLARVRRLRERLRLVAPRELLHAPGREPSFARALTAFAQAARDGTPCSPDFADGRAALAVVLAAERAAEGETLRAAE